MAKDASPKTIFLKEYKAPIFTILHVEFEFELDDTRTKVTTQFKIKQLLANKAQTLVMNAHDLEIQSVGVNGKELAKSMYKFENQELEIPGMAGEFDLTIVNWISPATNTALEGLYKSGGIYCTQNEPQGMRRIAPFIDRPDVMAKYKVTIIADEAKYPVLLSNGNFVSKQKMSGGRHKVVWLDPFPKPSYLFALVAGDLGLILGQFKTRSGRMVDLRVYCDKGNEDKCHHALESLKKSMKWDEDTFGLEYDLDIYMIVAVDAFNMGAMENKGLNIFNSVYVLADPKTATDQNFLAIEAVVAHEYFHNWTGNRVTCRDWFQLTLKEGLTVYRDQEFSSDLNSRAVKRIEDVRMLRSRQFPEDQGPNAHPIRPESYIEINNFYTPTVYEKGAEVIRMIHTFLGAKGFRLGMDKYFELYDGKAVTTDDFLHAMSIANGNMDFSQFKNWYNQAGTPDVDIQAQWNEENGELILEIHQQCRATKECQLKLPYHFPLSLGLLDMEGQFMPMTLSEAKGKHDLERGILHVTEKNQKFVFSNVKKKPLLSLNRGYGAPVRVRYQYSSQELAVLMAHDTDLFNRFEAGQVFMKKVIDAEIAGKTQEAQALKKPLQTAWGKLLTDQKSDKEFLAMALLPQDVEVLIQDQVIYQIQKTAQIREQLIVELATTHKEEILKRYESCLDSGAYSLGHAAIANRSLKNTLLYLMMLAKFKEAPVFAKRQFEKAGNMTDQLAAFKALIHHQPDMSLQASEQFYKQWKKEGLVMQKWLAVWATWENNSVIEKIRKLEHDPVFNIKIPNFVRALYRSFMTNITQFHRADGFGYELISEKILLLDKLNPHIASGLAKGFSHYKKLEPTQRQHLCRVLEDILNTKDLSRDTYEIIHNTLNA